MSTIILNSPGKPNDQNEPTVNILEAQVLSSNNYTKPALIQCISDLEDKLSELNNILQKHFPEPSDPEADNEL